MCAVCRSKYHRQHYELNKARYIEQATRNNPIQRQRARDYVLAYLAEHPCVDCKEGDPVVLDFDHLRDKKYNICNLVRNGASLETIRIEIEKCEVRCANCHRRRTAATFGHYRHAAGRPGRS